MTHFEARIREGDRVETERIIRVRGATIEIAAQHAARRLVGRGLTAHRVTGDPGRSGVFHAYRWEKKVSASVAVGEHFHMLPDY